MSTIPSSSINRGQCRPDFPRPDASRGDEFLLYGSQDRRPALYLAVDAFSSASSSIASGVGPPPFSESSGAVSTQDGRQLSGPPASNSPVSNTIPYLRSCEDQQHQEVWMYAFANVVTPVGTNRYQDNDMEAIVPYAPQKNGRQVSYRPLCLLRPGPVPRPYFVTRLSQGNQACRRHRYPQFMQATLSLHLRHCKQLLSTKVEPQIQRSHVRRSIGAPAVGATSHNHRCLAGIPKTSTNANKHVFFVYPSHGPEGDPTYIENISECDIPRSHLPKFNKGVRAPQRITRSLMC